MPWGQSPWHRMEWGMKNKLIIKKSTLLEDNRENSIIEDGREFLAKKGFTKDDIEYFADRMVGVLDDYAAQFGAGTHIDYSVRKHLGRIEAKVYIPGEKYDPFENGNDSMRRKIEKALALNMSSQDSCISHSYMMGRNVVVGSVPSNSKSKSLLKDPFLWATIIGVVIGIICLKLPEKANNFLLEDLMNPVYKTLLNILSGIMGPVIFISLITSIIALDSVNDLTNLGFKIFRRFLRIILFFVVVSIGISLLFFCTFGEGGIDFAPNQIIQMIIDIIPVNSFTHPFTVSSASKTASLSSCMSLS